MSEDTRHRASLRKAVEDARVRGDDETAEKLQAVLKAIEDVDATVVAALAAVVATL